jgi:hypothetical protein
MDITHDIAQPLVGDRHSAVASLGRGQGARAATGFPTVLLGGALLPRTTTFADRVRSNSGSIEDEALEGLYDPFFKTIKGFSAVGLSDLAVFVSASGIENNAGSIPKFFDASGNERDFSQTDTAKQPALNKSSIGGRWGAVLDGSEDYLTSSNLASPSWREGTVLMVGARKTSNYACIYSGDADVLDYWIFERPDHPDTYIHTDSSSLSWNNVVDQTPHVRVGRMGPNALIRIDATDRKTGTMDDDMGGTHDIGRRRGTPNKVHWEGPITTIVSFDAYLTTEQIADLEPIVNDYYNSIY